MNEYFVLGRRDDNGTRWVEHHLAADNDEAVRLFLENNKVVTVVERAWQIPKGLNHRWSEPDSVGCCVCEVCGRSGKVTPNGIRTTGRYFVHVKGALDFFQLLAVAKYFSCGEESASLKNTSAREYNEIRAEAFW